MLEPTSNEELVLGSDVIDWIAGEELGLGSGVLIGLSGGGQPRNLG